jgi:23S rRNA pseudouridine1911/1915/1917 synthase
MFERAFVVPAPLARERLDRFLEIQLPGVSRMRVRRAILDREITVNGVHRESGRRLAEGDLVEVRMAREPVRAVLPEEIPLDVLHEDDAILAVNKPAGMLVHPTSRVHSGTLLNAIIHHVARGAAGSAPPRPLLVHRLDHATSGVLVASKTPRAHRILARAFNERRVEKRYLALVCGRLESEEGLIDAPIGSSRETTPGFGVRPEGRPARTRYRLVRRYGPFTLVELEPLTGRTNQLRIHCAHAGAPIAGDDLHGQPELAAFRARYPQAVQPDRLFLHAARLKFLHPITCESLALEAPLPVELATFLHRLGGTAGMPSKFFSPL